MSATARDQAVDQVNETSQTIANIVPRHFGQRLADFFALCKPRVNTLIVFTAMIGMFLASPGFPPLRLFLFASLGIALVAGAAAAIEARNCVSGKSTSGFWVKAAVMVSCALTTARARSGASVGRVSELAAVMRSHPSSKSASPAPMRAESRSSCHVPPPHWRS